MVNKFGISKSTMVFKMPIDNFIKNNLKIMKKSCHKNASEFK